MTLFERLDHTLFIHTRAKYGHDRKRADYFVLISAVKNYSSSKAGPKRLPNPWIDITPKLMCSPAQTRHEQHTSVYSVNG